MNIPLGIQFGQNKNESITELLVVQNGGVHNSIMFNIYYLLLLLQAVPISSLHSLHQNEKDIHLILALYKFFKKNFPVNIIFQ